MSDVYDFLIHQLPGLDSNFRPSPVQAEYAGSIESALCSGGGRIHCIEGDTGIGKTLGYLLSAVEWLSSATLQRPRRVIVATHSRSLQRQLVKKSNKKLLDTFAEHIGFRPVCVALRMGRLNYVSFNRLMAILDTDSLASFAEDEAKPHLERELANWAVFSDGCLADLDDSMFPDHIRREDIAIAKHDALPDALADQFAQARDADIVVTNHALLVSDLVQQGASIGAVASGIEDVCLIVDEGEHFADSAEQSLAQTVSYSVVSRLAHELGYTANARHWDALLTRFTEREHAGQAAVLSDEHRQQLVEAVRGIRRTRKPDPDLSPSHAAWAELREILDDLESTLATPRSDTVLSYSEVRGLPSLVLARPTAGAVIQNGMEDRVTIFTSATLSDLQGEEYKPLYRHLLGGLGLSNTSPLVGQTSRHEAVGFGHMRFRLAVADNRPLEEANDGKHLSVTYARHAVAQIVTPRHGRTLVLCASYRDVARLDDHWPDTDRARVVTHGVGADLNVIAAGMSSNGILVTPAGWEGLSPERGNGPFWARVVLLRSPTPPVNPSDVLVTANRLMVRGATSRDDAVRRANIMLHSRAKTSALHKIRQGLGRGIRHRDDDVEIVILDPRFRHDGVMKNGRLAGQASAIPSRFQAEFRSEVSKNRPDKSPQLIL